MENALIIGSSGLLGSSLIRRLESKYSIKTISRSSSSSDYRIDMSCEKASLDVLTQIKPRCIINLAALTDVNACEEDVSLAYSINVKIAENIGKYLTCSNDSFLVHISTDHVYDSELSNENMVKIINNYALTKYSAELACKGSNTVILRTNFFGKSYSERSIGLCDSIYKQAKSGCRLNLFNDVYFSPVSIHSLCNVIELCMSKKIPGTYNVGSNGGMTKESFIREFLEQSGISDYEYDSVSVDVLEQKVNRPKDMRMDVRLFESTFDIKLPNLMDEIKRVANEFR
ncbi:TPA: NAD(P)-dependent oxidoreductase [Vibrio vulnificus]|uniref:SDR family oxidoreductase n=1 Tax=Vibrio vulnificus TaxID=672 RepID=UPI0032ED3C93